MKDVWLGGRRRRLAVVSIEAREFGWDNLGQMN